MSLLKFSFIIPEKKTTKGRSMSQKEYEAKKKQNFIAKWQPMKCSGKLVTCTWPDVGQMLESKQPLYMI